MRLFHYSTVSRLLHPATESMTIKAAYILGDGAVVTTGFDLMIILRREYNRRYNGDIRSRVKFLSHHLPIAKGQAADDIRLMLKAYKHLSTLKNRSAREFADLRRVEGLIAGFFNDFVNEKCAVFEQHGLHHLDDMPDKSGISRYNTNISTDAEDVAEDRVTASRILQLLGDNGVIPDDDVTFILQPEALTAPFRPARICSPHEADAAQEGTIWMEKLLSLPNINTLTGLELHTLRAGLTAPGRAFRAAFDHWLRGAKEETMSAAERLDWYASEVRPAAAPLREAVAGHPLLTALHGGGWGVGNMLDVWAGEMPLQAIWNFYEAAESMAATTARVLRSPAAAARGSLRTPVILLSVAGTTPDAAAEGKAGEDAADSDAPPVSVRRHISLD